jgi:BirA family biotin operon repressor/biotin-[acetyl-CoA-carboxylase] ligase
MSRGAGRTALAVLRRLEAAGGAVSGEALSHELAVSRMAICKAVAHLRVLGCEIDSAPHRGYQLVQSTDQPAAFAVQPLLRTAELGRHWVYEFQLPSTNRTAAELAVAGAPPGLVVVADAQTQGQGRMGRHWHSPAGRNLYVSVLLRPSVPPVRVPQISLLAALALRRALLALCPALPVGVKWPNDLWVGGRKLAGVLCEMDAEVDRVRHVVVGLGLNVNLTADEWPEALAGRATSLRIESGRPWPRPQVLGAFLNALEPLLREWEAADDLGPFLGELDQASVLRGRRIRVECGQRTSEGVAAGIALDGRLRLRADGGDELLLSSGDAHLLDRT